MTENFNTLREKTKLLRLTAEELKKNYCLTAFHMRGQGGGFVVAEGEAEAYSPEQGVTGVACLHDFPYAFYGGSGRLKGLATGGEYALPACKLLYYPMTDGTENVYAVTRDTVYKLTAAGATPVATGKGGYCATVFCERVFAADGCRVSYSDALAPDDWQEKRYGAGFLELAHSSGEIYAMVPYKERLYLFRKHGITALRVLGDELNFKASYLPLKQGALLSGSVAVCGEGVGYFTDRGFYLFHGSSSKLCARAEELKMNTEAPVKAVSCRGKYYALVSRTSGEKALFAYDPDEEEWYFIENGAEDVAADEEIYFLRANKIYRLTERGLCNQFTPCLTVENVAFTVGEERSLYAVSVEGKGRFCLTVSSLRGTRTATVQAGETVRLRSPLRGGSFSLSVQAASVDACVRALEFAFTEEEDGN